MSEQTIYDWGQAPPGPPSTRRVDPLSWVVLSLLGGLVVASLALLLLWRPLPGLPAPPGALAVHAEHWAKLAARLLLSGWFPKEAQAYAKFWGECLDSEKLAIAWRLAVALMVACAPGFLLAGSLLRPRDGLLHLRGSRRFEGAKAVSELRRRLSDRAKRRPDHEIAPGVPYPADLWTRHVLVVGGVGSGKSTAMKPLIDKVVACGEQMLLFDPKSEFTIGWAAPAIVAPWDARSLVWDLARDMRNTLDMRRFAAAMIRESQDPMWSNASRQLLVGLMIHLRATRGADWGWRELAELVALPQPQLRPIMEAHHPEALRAVEKASVTTAGILINLSSFCASIFDLARAWGDAPLDRRVSFVEWTAGRSRHPQIILQGHGAYGELTRSYAEGIVGIVSAMVNSVEMRDDPSRKIWFIADEFAQLGKIPVRALFEVGRSRGVRCVVATQDLAQLEEIHGAQMVKAIVSMCGTLLVGQMMQGDTAEALCKTFGTREVERANISSSYQGTGGSSNRSSTLSFNRDEIALYKPSELASRLGLTPDGRGVKLILFTGGDAFELVWSHFQLREEREGHAPAAWTMAEEACTPAVERAAPGATPAAEHEARVASLANDAQSAGDMEELAEASALGESIVVQSRADSREDEALLDPDAAEFDDAAEAELASHLTAGGDVVLHAAVAVELAIDPRPGPREDVFVRQKHRSGP